MANRVVMRICGQEFTFIAEESAEYVQRVGAYVGEKMQEVLSGGRVARTDAAVLTAVNIADELFRMRMTDEQLRGQVKRYLDEAAEARAEISDLKREILRLQKAGRKPGEKAEKAEARDPKKQPNRPKNRKPQDAKTQDTKPQDAKAQDTKSQEPAQAAKPEPAAQPEAGKNTAAESAAKTPEKAAEKAPESGSDQA